jgi:hypothetical protein
MLDFIKTTYFGPLSKNSCIYFQFLTILFFILLIVALFFELVFVFRKFNQLNTKIFTSGILLLFNLFIAYFVNRLLFTMCNKSLSV